MLCPLHQKELKQGKFGWYCATPEKDDQGNVVSWCKYKPGTIPVKPINQKVIGRTQEEWDKIGRVKALCGMVNGMLGAGVKPQEIDLADLSALVQKIESLADFITKDNKEPF